MEENRFFKLVWRFNGLIISVAGVLAVVVLAFVTYKLFQEVTRERSTHNIVNVDGHKEVDENWRLGHLSEVGAGKNLMIPLYSDQSFNQDYFSKSSNSIRNYLFINTDTSQKKWLFDHTNYLIEQSDRVSLGDYSSREPVAAILYQLVKLDSDHDDRLSANDLTTVAITNPDGTGYQELIQEVDSVTGHKLLNETELFIIYQKRGASYSAIIDLVSRELTRNSVLPAIGS